MYIKHCFDLVGSLRACKTGSFGESLVLFSKGHIKCASLNNRPCQTLSTLADIKFN